MKALFWLGIALLVMLPVNFLVVTIGRLLSGEVFGARAVSYTHLTLPTIYSV